MKVLDVEQGSAAWINARLGIPTASNFHKIITPRTLKPSSSQQKYLAHLLAEWVTGRTDDAAVSEYMTRGTEQEKQAAAYWECEREMQLEKVGFILRDDGLVGCSPDRLVVGAKGLVELKVPALETHLLNLLGGDMDDYRCQVQGQLWLAEREWVELVSYNGTQPSAILRYDRDEEFIEALVKQVDRFLHAMKQAKEKLLELGVVRLAAEQMEGVDLTLALAGEVLD